MDLVPSFAYDGGVKFQTTADKSSQMVSTWFELRTSTGQSAIQAMPHHTVISLIFIKSFTHNFQLCPSGHLQLSMFRGAITSMANTLTVTHSPARKVFVTIEKWCRTIQRMSCVINSWTLKIERIWNNYIMKQKQNY